MSRTTAAGLGLPAFLALAPQLPAQDAAVKPKAAPAAAAKPAAKAASRDVMPFAATERTSVRRRWS